MLQPRIAALGCRRLGSCLGQTVRQYASVTEAAKSSPSSSAPPMRSAPVTSESNSRSSSSSSANVRSVPTSASNRSRGSQSMRTFVPRSPGLRHLKQIVNDYLWKGPPLRKLTYPKIGHAKGGRNHSGQITVRHRGGGVRRRIRTVDWERNEPGEQLVVRIEYDPNRTAHLALLKHKTSGTMSYIVATDGMRKGDTIESYRAGIPKSLITLMGGRIDPAMFAAKTCVQGNCLPIQLIPPGTQVNCVGSHPKRGAVFCRSAGTFATVLGKDTSTPQLQYMIVKLQSGETRKVSKSACATVGVVSNAMNQYQQLGKAGRSRWMNIRPTVRGMAMNACDHPHGGGRGKSKGNRIPVSPWGKQAKSGKKSRVKSNVNRFVVQARPRNQGKRRNKS